jgi:uncharacterized protein with NAD-binding domain and iron-sulfur cluster
MRKTRVAIIGGGCGGVAAAFWLSSPELEGRVDVPVYSRGWRLGGKGASGRANTPDHRIEEHGLHLWLGCYHRAFQMMRLCYAEQRAPRPFTMLSDAFLPLGRFALQSRSASSAGGRWSPWSFDLPTTDAFPGTGDSSVLRALPIRIIENLRHRLGRRCEDREPAGAARDSWRQRTSLATLGLVFAKGLMLDLILRPGGYSKNIARLESIDFRAWLVRHGASETIVDSAPVRAIYDLAFAYPGGDCGQPGQLAAGSTIGLILELIGYRGAPMFKMRSAMGDTIFAPLYRVLRQRGVNVSLFHRLRSVTADAGQHSLSVLNIERQVNLVSGDYEPLIQVAGAECWPDEPLWEQIEDGAALGAAGVNLEDSKDSTVAETMELRAGRDFDVVILAVPPDMLKETTADLQNSHWRTMLDNSASVATQAFQLWLGRNTADLGWVGGDLVSAYDPPFSTWADMSHLLPCETWPDADGPKSIHYFCGPMRDADAAGSSPKRTVEDEMARWLERSAAGLWPNYAGAANGRIDFASTHANVDPSERYVQAPPGSISARLAADAAVYENLYLAGDWTRTRYCGGCVENAVQSGLTAARAISGRPDLGGLGRRWK